jgi:hypothetical protein
VEDAGDPGTLFDRDDLLPVDGGLGSEVERSRHSGGIVPQVRCSPGDPLGFLPVLLVLVQDASLAVRRLAQLLMNAEASAPGRFWCGN